MSHAITSDTPVPDVPTVTNPLAIAGYAATRESRNVIHDTLDGGVGVSYLAPRPRRGTLTTVYTDETEAWLAESMYAHGRTFTLYPAAVAASAMRFVIDGGVTITQDDENVSIWYVDIEYQEVPV